MGYWPPHYRSDCKTEQFNTSVNKSLLTAFVILYFYSLILFTATRREQCLTIHEQTIVACQFTCSLPHWEIIFMVCGCTHVLCTHFLMSVCHRSLLSSITEFSLNLGFFLTYYRYYIISQMSHSFETLYLKLGVNMIIICTGQKDIEKFYQFTTTTWKLLRIYGD